MGLEKRSKVGRKWAVTFLRPVCLIYASWSCRRFNIYHYDGLGYLLPPWLIVEGCTDQLILISDPFGTLVYLNIAR